MAHVLIEHRYTNRDGIEVDDYTVLQVDKENRKQIFLEIIDALRQDVENMQDITKFKIIDLEDGNPLHCERIKALGNNN